MGKLKFDDNVKSKLYFEDKTRNNLQDRDFSQEIGANWSEPILDSGNNLISLYLHQKSK